MPALPRCLVGASNGASEFVSENWYERQLAPGMSAHVLF